MFAGRDITVTGVALVGEVMVTEVTLSVNVMISAVEPILPVAVTVKVTPRSDDCTTYPVLTKFPPSATEVSVTSGWTLGVSTIVIVTVSPGCQQVPVKITVSPGE